MNSRIFCHSVDRHASALVHVDHITLHKSVHCWHNMTRRFLTQYHLDYLCIVYNI